MEKNMKMKTPEGLNLAFQESLPGITLVFKEAFNTPFTKEKICSTLEDNLNLPSTSREV